MQDTTPSTSATFAPSGRRYLLGALMWTTFTQPDLLEIGPCLTPPEVKAWLAQSPEAGHRLTPDHLRAVLQCCGVKDAPPEVPEMALAAGDEILVSTPWEDPSAGYRFRLYRLWRLRS